MPTHQTSIKAGFLKITVFWSTYPRFQIESIELDQLTCNVAPFPQPATSEKGVSAHITRLASAINAYVIKGQPLSLPLELLCFKDLSRFAQDVMLTLASIPSGKVISYGGLAAAAGYPGAPRAVGCVMAHNRFPLLIPCHRVVQSDGRLGGFGPGEPLKRRILHHEGVNFGTDGRVLPSHFLERPPEKYALNFPGSI